MKKSNKNKSILLMLLGRPNGFSLVEIMVAAGMLGVVSLGVMQMTKNMNRSTKKMKQDFEVQTVISNIQKQITDNAACSFSFNGVGLNGDNTYTEITEIKDKDDEVIAARGQDLGVGSGATVHIEFIGIRGYVNTAVTPNTFGAASPTFYNDEVVNIGGAATNYRRGTAEVLVRFRKGFAAWNPDLGGAQTAEQERSMKEASQGALEFYRTFTVEVLANGTNVVQSCYGDQQQYAEAACGMLNGYIDNGICVDMSFVNNAAPTGTNLGPNPGPQDTQYAFQALGNVTIRPNTGAGDQYGAAGGTAPANTTAGSFSVGIVPNAASPSNLDIFGSAGIGAANETSPISDNATPGNLDVYNGVAVHGLHGTTPQGLSVGDGTPIAGQGNILATGNVGAGSAAGVAGIFANANMTNNSLYAQGRLGVGVTPPRTTSDVTANINGHTRIAGGLSVGTSLANTPTTNGVVRVNNSLGVGPVAPPAGAGDALINNNLQVNTSATIGSAYVGAAGTLRVNSAVGVGANPLGTAATIAVGPDITIGENGASASTRVAIKIRGMGTYAQEASGGTLPAQTRLEVPTKDWVMTALGDILSRKADLDAIAAEISGYITSNPLSGIQQTVCTDTRVQINGQGYVTGTWDGTRCNLDATVAVCGSSNAAKCSTFWSTHFRAVGGHFYARNSADTTTTAYIRGSDGRIYTSNHLRVAGNAEMNSHVRASRFCIGSTAASNCITRAESRCGAGQVVVGWEQGQVTCVNSTSAGW